MSNLPVPVEESEILPASALEAITRSEIDSQIATARKFPRNLSRSIEKAKYYATFDRDTASECHYSVPRAGKKIEGPSVRLAEIVATTWGNLRVASRVMAIDDREVTCGAVCHDLESNVAISTEVKKRIVDKNGNRYSDDMVIMTANAGCATAFRNAVFRAIPKALWGQVYESALEVMRNGKDPKDMSDRRQKAINYFMSQGISKAKILTKLGVRSIEEMGPEHLQTLVGFWNAIKEDTASIDDIFEPSKPMPTAVESKIEPEREPGSDG